MQKAGYMGEYGITTRNSDLALYSLVAGVLSYFLFPIIGAIAAVIMGHMALGEIRRSHGMVGGRSMAVGGLILGYIQVIGVILLVLLGILGLFFFFASGSGVKVEGDKVMLNGPGGTKIEVIEPDRVRICTPGSRIEVDGEEVVVEGPGGARIEVRSEEPLRRAQGGGRVALELAKTDISDLRKGLERFRRDVGTYPTTEESLLALLGNPGGPSERAWKGPYFKKLPLDPWSNSYQYRFEGEKGKAFDLYSFGPDGEESEDDVR